MWSKENKKVIKEVVVVEGKTDTCKLKSIFDVQTIETNGLNLSKSKMNEIKRIAKTKGIILFLDPDGPGEKIRKKIMEEVPGAFNCFIKKDDIKRNSKKIGIAEANVEAIIKAFDNVKKFTNNNKSLEWNEYIDLNLDNKQKRQIICDKLKISCCNNKQLFKRLNMLDLSFEQIKEIIKK